MKPKSCEHINALKDIKTANAYECSECTKTSDSWVHLRTCQTCGVTLCCDSSPNKHASAHAQQVAHAVISSAEPGEKWLWCYEDKFYTKY